MIKVTKLMRATGLGYGAMQLLVFVFVIVIHYLYSTSSRNLILIWLNKTKVKDNIWSSTTCEIEAWKIKEAHVPDCMAACDVVEIIIVGKKCKVSLVDTASLQLSSSSQLMTMMLIMMIMPMMIMITMMKRRRRRMSVTTSMTTNQSENNTHRRHWHNTDPSNDTYRDTTDRQRDRQSHRHNRSITWVWIRECRGDECNYCVMGYRLEQKKTDSL